MGQTLAEEECVQRIAAGKLHDMGRRFVGHARIYGPDEPSGVTVRQRQQVDELQLSQSPFAHASTYLRPTGDNQGDANEPPLPPRNHQFRELLQHLPGKIVRPLAVVQDDQSRTMRSKRRDQKSRDSSGSRGTRGIEKPASRLRTGCLATERTGQFRNLVTHHDDELTQFFTHTLQLRRVCTQVRREVTKHGAERPERPRRRLVECSCSQNGHLTMLSGVLAHRFQQSAFPHT